MGLLRHRATREVDVTGPGVPSEVPDADRAEQDLPLDPLDAGPAAGASPPGDGVPEADALEQQVAVGPGRPGVAARPVGDREANEADVLDQLADVPVDEDDVPG
jgi:hypothetical protein